MAAVKCPPVPTGPPKLCTLMHDRMNEPPPQPRIRKITTIINTLGVIVRDSATEIVVWVWTSCEEKSFPKTNQHMFMGFQLGTWLIVGIYPDGTIASFSPWSLVLKACETKVVHDQVFIKICSSELHHEKTVRYIEVVSHVFHSITHAPYLECEPHLTAEFYTVPGFGRILVSSNLRQQVENNNFNFWAQYCEGTVKGCSWIMSSMESTSEDAGGVQEKDLRTVGEYIKEKRSKAEVILCPDKYASRNLGIVFEIHGNKQNLNCWSPFGPFEADHIAKIPQSPKHRELDSPMLDPVIGQWIQFDVISRDLDRYMGKKPGYRLSIPEYLPINSPCGIGVISANKTIRLAISCILVTGTDHPFLYELPTFGYVIDPKSSLISGAYMQLILEKTTSKIRRSSGVCWKLISSVVVDISDVTVEKIKDIRNEAILLKDSMEACKLIPVEKQPSTTQSKGYSAQSTMTLVPTSALTGVTTLKYQQPQHQTPYHDPKKDYYSGNQIRLPSNYSSSTRNSRYVPKPGYNKLSAYSEKVLEVHGIVEKVNDSKSGILWLFDHFNTSVHFIFDDFGFAMGSYVYATLEKHQDISAKCGFKWKWIGGVRKPAPFVCHVSTTNIFIEVELEYNTQSSMHRHHQYRSKHFPLVLDLDGHIPNPVPGTSYPAVILRKRLPDYETSSAKSRFYWTIYSLQSPFYTPKDSFPHSYSRGFGHKQKSNISSMPEIKRSASSDHSSVSPPINCSSLPSSEE